MRTYARTTGGIRSELSESITARHEFGVALRVAWRCARDARRGRGEAQQHRPRVDENESDSNDEGLNRSVRSIAGCGGAGYGVAMTPDI